MLSKFKDRVVPYLYHLHCLLFFLYRIQDSTSVGQISLAIIRKVDQRCQLEIKALPFAWNLTLIFLKDFNISTHNMISVSSKQ